MEQIHGTTGELLTAPASTARRRVSVSATNQLDLNTGTFTFKDIQDYVRTENYQFSVITS